MYRPVWMRSGLVMNHWRDEQEAFLKFKTGCDIVDEEKRLESIAGFYVLPTSELTSVFLFPGICCQ
ncbi:unnamed protein product [Tuber melanosporum]|uniref:(Perigord truffle) hypothetical protein n=1 Tax=Tuber melanosporum (strain Mel28) TaxID=656061 RepID=D5GG92_TUBMM|nr:uncharacterized protein GSTUM_00007268001 [Tuber melanosporum]CAZ83535.1 unnamed protein product [Tuber melanosporum]